MGIFMALAGILAVVFKALYFVLKKTGLWYYLLLPVLTAANCYIAVSYMRLRYGYTSMEEVLAHMSGASPSPMGWAGNILANSDMPPGTVPLADWALFWAFLVLTVFVAMTIFRTAVRLVRHDPEWTYRKAVGGGNRDMRRATDPTVHKGLLQPLPLGITFGKKKGSYVCRQEREDGHVLVIGGAGSGKSSTVAIPTLISWREKVFAIDIKGELLARTGKNRPNVKLFDPLDPGSCGYDPFLVLDKDSHTLVSDMREIALSVVPLPKDTKDPFWIEAAQQLFTGALLHCYMGNMGFIEAIEFIQSTPPSRLVETVMGSTSKGRLFVSQFVDMDEKTVSGVMGELSNKIIPFATDGDIQSALSRKKVISPEDFMNEWDIYLRIPEDKMEQWKTLLGLIVNQFLKAFERRPEGDSRPLLFLLDEFPRLGKIQAVLDGLATLRSKKVTIALFVQSLAQLDLIYGTEARKVIADNCSYKAVLQASDADTQDYLSKLVGTHEKEKRSRGQQYAEYTGMGKGKSTSLTTEEKRIIRPEEFAALTDTILFTPYGFYRIERAPYYRDAYFRGLV